MDILDTVVSEYKTVNMDIVKTPEDELDMRLHVDGQWQDTPYPVINDLIRNSGVNITSVREPDDQDPNFNWSVDRVFIPSMEAFHGNVEAYAHVTLHELVHWTGHESRLNRLSPMMGGPPHEEEIIADMGAELLMAQFGLATRSELDRGESYVNQWSGSNNEDPFYTALLELLGSNVLPRQYHTASGYTREELVQQGVDNARKAVAYLQQFIKQEK